MSINSWAGSSFLKSVLNTGTPRLVWESQIADFFLQLLYQLVSGNVSLKVENKRFSIKCIFLDFFSIFVTSVLLFNIPCKTFSVMLGRSSVIASSINIS